MRATQSTDQKVGGSSPSERATKPAGQALVSEIAKDLTLALTPSRARLGWMPYRSQLAHRGEHG
jgi:hypothetical protein